MAAKVQLIHQLFHNTRFAGLYSFVIFNQTIIMKSILSALLLLAFTLSAAAQEKKDPIDEQMEACLAEPDGQSTNGMCQCTYAALDKWEKKLNKVYNTLKPMLSVTAKTKLTEAQRLWIQFREKEIALIDATTGKMDGTMWRIVRASQVMEITKKRTLELEHMLDIQNGYQ